MLFRKEQDQAQALFRTMSGPEKAILSRLLEDSFPGRDELLAQSSNCKVRSLDDWGSLEFSSPNGPKADVDRRIPVEAAIDDLDGIVIHLLLHVLDGSLNELEIFREDSGALLRRIDPAGLSVLIL